VTTVNVGLLVLGVAETVTTTGPLVAPVGTGAVMLVSLHAVGVAAVPLKVTVLEPKACDARKFDPVIVTLCPTAAAGGFKDVTVGVVCAAARCGETITAATQMTIDTAP
jgi:hypothetical protein